MNRCYEIPLLYANHPDGTASPVIYDSDDQLITLRGDLETGEGVEEDGPFDSIIEACQHLRETLLSELDALAFAEEGKPSSPVVELAVEGGISGLHRAESGLSAVMVGVGP